MSGGIPYLGSKISLISKSEIRYEGILYTIDTKESTIALAKVRSFGTEDRPTDRPVIPRNEVYEYIIFRASDIKDLHVCEAPKHQQTLASGLPNDPAIVEHSAPVSTSAGFPSSTFRPSSGYGPVGALPFQYNVQQSTVLPHLSQSFVASASHHSGSRSGTPTPTPQQRKSPTMDAGVQVTASDQTSSRDETKERKVGGGPRQQQHPVSGGQQKQRSTSSSRPQQQNKPSQQQQSTQYQSQPQRTRTQRRGRGQRGRQSTTARPKEVLQFDSEFDFEQANAEFQELQNKLGKIKIDDLAPPVEEKKEDSENETPAGEGHEEDGGYFYDKTKSFFDNISCEALARSKGNFERLDWRQERKLNVETFGVSARNNWRRNAWRGRGFRGRGAFRGSRGGISRGARGGGGQRTV